MGAHVKDLGYSAPEPAAVSRCIRVRRDDYARQLDEIPELLWEVNEASATARLLLDNAELRKENALALARLLAHTKKAGERQPTAGLVEARAKADADYNKAAEHHAEKRHVYGLWLGLKESLEKTHDALIQESAHQRELLKRTP